MNLLAIQQRMHAWLTRPGGNDDTGAHDAPGYGVYQNNYRAQLVRCLETSYPMLCDWLGREAFLQAAIQHIDRHPPHAWTLDAYGADFTATLHERYPHNPDVRELAWIEWSLSESFVAADAQATPVHTLGELDWESARLRPAPSLRQCRVTTNVAALWHAWLAGESLPESEMLPVAGGLITWRTDLVCQLRQLDPVEHAALLLLHDDDRFAGLCAALVEHLGEDAGVRCAGEWLADWLQSGIVQCVT